MNIDTHIEGGTLFVNLHGRLDTVTTPGVNDAINAALENCASCALDMADVDYVSSAGLRLLLLLHKNMQAAGGGLSLRNVQPGVMDILEMTGFASFLAVE